MNESRLRPPIIAIFGGDEDAAEAAFELGKLIAAKEGIVLTGGTGGNCKTVKDAAICGAEAGGGRWIGVNRKEPDNKRDARFEGTGLVLEFAVGNRRNFLEAYMCDVAIALPGGAGTDSEVASCVLLKRPVHAYGWAGSAMHGMQKRIRRASGEAEIPALDQQILQVTPVTPSSNGITDVRHKMPGQVVGELLEDVKGQRPGAFPPFFGADYHEMQRKYEEFLGP